MIENSVLKNTFAGKDGYRWFIGMVPINSTPDSETWGERVPVRVLGYHDGLSDAELPLAVIVKTTATGFGNRQSSGLVGGESVVGFFADGENAQQPIITGVMDRNVNDYAMDRQDVAEQGSSGFFSTFPYSNNLSNSYFQTWRTGIPQGGSNPQSLTAAEGQAGVTTSFTTGTYRLSGDDTDKGALSPSLNESIELAALSQEVNGPSNCGDTIVDRIQVEISKIAVILRGIQKYYEVYVVSAINKVYDFIGSIRQIIGNISAVMRTLVQRLRNFVLGKVRELISNALDIILGDVLKDIKDTVLAKVLDLIFCAFQIAVEDLPGLIGDFVAALLGRISSAPLCSAEQFINALLNNVVGGIESALNPILDEISDLLGGVLDIGGAISSAINQILGLFGFLCLEKKCVEVTKFSASPWGGPSKKNKDNYDNFLSQLTLEDISDDAEDWLNEAGLVAGGSPVCNTSPSECGPPRIDLFGGNPSAEALASAVVSGDGRIIGALIEQTGAGYNFPPFVTFNDPCNRGNSASGVAVLDPESGGVIRIDIINGGVDYTPIKDGTTIFDPPPDRNPVDRIVVPTPDGGSVTIPDVQPDPGDGDGGDDIPGRDGLPRPDIVIPDPRDDDGDDGGGDGDGDSGGGDDRPDLIPVPVIGCLDNIRILNTGINYQDGDEITTIPTVPGLELIGRFTEFGQLVAIDIKGNTCGFNVLPDIIINSRTGAGAEVRASLRFQKAEDYFANDQSAKYAASVLSVVQCYSKSR